jgi:hypothetical protein
MLTINTQTKPLVKTVLPSLVQVSCPLYVVTKGLYPVAIRPTLEAAFLLSVDRWIQGEDYWYTWDDGFHIHKVKDVML